MLLFFSLPDSGASGRPKEFEYEWCVIGLVAGLGKYFCVHDIWALGGFEFTIQLVDFGNCASCNSHQRSLVSVCYPGEKTK